MAVLSSAWIAACLLPTLALFAQGPHPTHSYALVTSRGLARIL